MVGRCYTSPLKSTLGSGSVSLVCLICLAGFLKTLSPSGPFTSDSVFWPKTNSKVAIIKTKSATIAFFFVLFLSFSSLVLFLLSFFFVTVILELLGLKKHAF